MAGLNIEVSGDLHNYITEQALSNSLLTPSEYVCDLIRKDMQQKNQLWEDEIANMLVSARNSPTMPLAEDFFDQQRARILRK